MEPKILFLDIETAPDVVWTWGVYQANAIAVKEHWYLLSFAAKWRGSKDVLVKGLVDYKGYKGGSSTERELLEDVWALLDDADIVVAHNGASFDCKKLNARFIAHDMLPPSPYKVVDTKRDLKKVAVYSSNRLNWLSKQFKIGSKTMEHHDFELWQGCMDGDRKSWKEMKEYNSHDVVLLEKLYNKIAAWIPQPNGSAHSSDQRCPNPACNSRKLHARGYQRTTTRIYRRFQCQACGTWSRDRVSLNSAKVVRAI